MHIDRRKTSVRSEIALRAESCAQSDFHSSVRLRRESERTRGRVTQILFKSHERRISPFFVDFHSRLVEPPRAPAGALRAPELDQADQEIDALECVPALEQALLFERGRLHPERELIDQPDRA